MLQLITGGSGCGKTYYIRQQLCALAREGKTPILIVPEQYSFQSEREMLSLLGAKDAHNVRVYSFTRLAEDMARFAGGSAGRRLDDCGRVAAMGLVLSKIGSHLEYYRGKRSYHFIEHLLDAVKEFKLCALAPTEIARAAAQSDGRLAQKLSELALIYGAYDAVTAQLSPGGTDDFRLHDTLRDEGLFDRDASELSLDPMDDLDRLYEQLEEIRFFEGMTVYIDSFRGYTGQELRVIGRIMQQAELCAITVGLEHAPTPAEAESGLFATALSTVGQLKSTAEKYGCGILPEVVLSKRYRFNSEPLGVLESSLFRREEDKLVWDEPTDHLTLYEAADRNDELEFCARECRRLVREEGYRCKDIAIIARSESTYAPIASDALGQQELPCFADLRVDASGSPLMRFVLSAMEAAKSNMRSADMLRCLKTGMIDGINPSDIAELENYCYIWNVPAGGWERLFEQNPDGMGARASESTTQRLERINEVRERLCSLILPLRAALRSGEASQMTAAVFELVESSGTAACLEALSAGLSPTEAAELPQLWDLLIAILEQLHAILGGESCSADDFIAYISLMIKRADVGHIPHGLDEITFGGADRLRVNSPRAVFVVGALEGEFPAVPGSAGVFTDDERRRLREELGVQVADTADARMLEERLLVYNALTAASDRLYITWPAAAGSELAQPSECVAEALSCIPNARRLHHGAVPSPEQVGSADAAFELYARCLGEGDPLAASLRAALMSREEWAGRVSAVDAAHTGDSPAPLSAACADELFGKHISLSASRAETYHQCRYRYFCRYGLGIQPLRKAELDGMEYGTVAHYVLEHIFKGGSSFASIAADPVSTAQKVAALIERYLSEELGGEEGKTPGFLYRLRTMQGSLTALVTNLAAELASSGFVPVSYELKIGREGPVVPKTITSGGISGHLTGSIDRVDRYDSGSGSYLRVIDYKTGKKSFKLSDVLEGLNMQMIIYLSELCASQPETQPAGLLYCPAFSGYTDGDREDNAAVISGERDKALRRGGMVIEPDEHMPSDRPAEDTDLPVSRAMEHNLQGHYIPVTLLKSGKTAGMLSKDGRRTVISGSQFELVGRYVRQRLKDMLEQIGQGRLCPDPIAQGQFSLCDKCDYYSVCRHTGELRTAQNMDTREALAEMNTRLSQGGEQS